MDKKMKRIYKPRDFYRLVEDVLCSAGASRKLPKEEHISKTFQERIMMAVTEVNGCRYCSYFHTRVALQAGLGMNEIRQTLTGDFNDAPPDQLSALYFAQHYAESQGYPAQDAIKCMEDEYGKVRTNAILAYIRAIMVGNAWGNMLDALGMRLKGQPYSDQTMADELAVVFGVIALMPILIAKHIYQRVVANFATS